MASNRVGPAVRWLAASAAVAALVGCDDAPFKIVPVSGKVTYEDGTPIPAERLSIMFYPQMQPVEGKFHPKAGVAEVDPATGEFDSLTTHKVGDGAIVGEHKVYIVPMTQRGEPAPPGLVPREFTNSQNTPLNAKVEKRGDTFEFKIPNPKKR